MRLTHIATFACASLLALTLAGCNNANTQPDSSTAEAPAKKAYSGPAVTIASVVPLTKDSNASEAVRKECALDTRLPEFIESQATEQGVKVVRGSASPKGKGRVLVMEISHVLGTGGGAWSGPKSVTVDGKLYDNGKLIGSFQARRQSGGGAWGGYKSTCAILGRCVEALGSDIAEFLAKPSMNVKLGDA